MRTSREVEQILGKANKIAEKYNHAYLSTEHFLLAILKDKNYKTLLNDFGVQVEQLVLDLESHIAKKYNTITSKNLNIVKTQTLERVFNRAFTSVLFSGREEMNILDLFVSIMSESNTHSSYFLMKYNVTKDEFIKFVKSNRKHSAFHKKHNEYIKGIIQEYCEDYSELAKNKKLDPVIGRDDIIDDICQTFARRNKSNVLLVGDPGVGKTAIAEGLAVKVNDKAVPKYLLDHTVYNMDIATMIAGTQYRGQFEERVKETLEALITLGNVILFIDEAHTLKGAGAGGQGGTDFANILKPYLGRGKLKVIASTTWEEYNSSFEKDRALMRRFYHITVDEPSAKIAKEILTKTKQYYEKFHNCTITQEAIEDSVDLSMRYLTDKRLPDKAFDLIDSACAKQRRLQNDNATIGKNNILEEISKYAKIPVDQIVDKKNKTIDPQVIEDKIKEKVYGQDESIDKVLQKVWVAKAGLNKSDKTLGVFVFTGPTGTGKTELAKQLALSSSMKLLKYDMSEYQEKHTVARFIGAPPGYVGFEDSNLGGGLLIKDISQNPHSVILFDEIEKAHPDVSNVLLQMMDEGFVTSSNGKKADCRNCYIILTTNLGASEAEKNNIGFGSFEKTGVLQEAYKNYFAPEFRNRIDDVCNFNKLDELAQRKVCLKFVNELEKQLKEKNISMHIDEPSMDFIIKEGYNELLGARPMARAVDKLLRMPISKQLLVDKDVKGSKIKIRVNNETLLIKFRYIDGTTKEIADISAKALIT
mgnify:FL=1